MTSCALVGAVPTYVYTHAIHGFAAQMTEEEALKLSEDDRVAFVEEDSVVEANVTQNNPPWGLDRIDQTRPAAQHDLLVHDHRIRRERLHHRYRDSTHAPAVRRACVCGVRRHQRRAEHQRLQRSWHARGRNGRRIDLRRREGRAAVCRARPQLQRLGLQLGGHRGSELGHGQSHRPGGREHEPRWRRVDRVGQRRAQFHRRRGDLRDRRRQRESECGQLVAGARRPRPSPSGRRRAAMRVRRSPTSGAWSTSSRPGRRSCPPGERATPPRPR